MPLHIRQVSEAIANMRLWEEYMPCPSDSELGDEQAMTGAWLGREVSLVLLLNCARDVLVENELLNAFDSLSGSARSCFSNVQVQFSSLSREEDNYLTGSRLMFEKILDDTLRLESPSYVLLMEPDCLPIRNYWLSFIDAQTRFPNTPFWIKGSIFRGEDRIISRQQLPNKFHINGNAIYNLGDRSFPHFYFKILLPFIRWKYRSTAYDVDTFVFLQDLQNYHYTRHVVHFFQFSDFVQNHYHSEYSLKAVKKGSPTVVLVHGGYQRP